MRKVFYRWLLPALVASCAFGQEDERAEQWLAKRATDLSAWETLSNKWVQASASVAPPVENLVLPLEHYESGREKGRIRTLLKAERAQLLEGGLVFARNVKVDLLQPDGKPEATLVAEDCLLDRNTKKGFSRGVVDVKAGPDHLKGRGIYFSTDEQFIKILSECEIRTFRIPAKFGRL